MTSKQFYDWQTNGGTNDVMHLISVLEKSDIKWCAIGGIAVNHWAKEPMVTQDFDFVVAKDDIERTIHLLENEGFQSKRYDWPINFRGHSNIIFQMSTEDFYYDFPIRAIPADVHGILLRVASLEDTLRGKIRAYCDAERRKSKKIKDLSDIARLLEAHPEIEEKIPNELVHKLKDA